MGIEKVVAFLLGALACGTAMCIEKLFDKIPDFVYYPIAFLVGVTVFVLLTSCTWVHYI